MEWGKSKKKLKIVKKQISISITVKNAGKYLKLWRKFVHNLNLTNLLTNIIKVNLLPLSSV